MQIGRLWLTRQLEGGGSNGAFRLVVVVEERRTLATVLECFTQTGIARFRDIEKRELRYLKPADVKPRKLARSLKRQAKKSWHKKKGQMVCRPDKRKKLAKVIEQLEVM